MLKNQLNSEYTQFQSFQETLEILIADRDEEISEMSVRTISTDIAYVFEELDQQIQMKKRLSTMMRGCTSLIDACDSLVNEAVLNPVLKQVSPIC